MLVGPQEVGTLLLPQGFFVAVAEARESHPEDPGTPPPAALPLQGRWSLEEVHLGLLTRWMLHHVRYFGVLSLDPAHQTLDRRVAVAEAVLLSLSS